MSRRCTLKKPDEIEYIHVTTESLDIAESFCLGSIKGISLPRKDRCIDFWSKNRDTEQRANIGDYIVRFFPGIFEVYPAEMFHQLFKDTDDVCY